MNEKLRLDFSLPFEEFKSKVLGLYSPVLLRTILQHSEALVRAFFKDSGFPAMSRNEALWASIDLGKQMTMLELDIQLRRKHGG